LLDSIYIYIGIFTTPQLNQNRTNISAAVVEKDDMRYQVADIGDLKNAYRILEGTSYGSGQYGNLGVDGNNTKMQLRNKENKRMDCKRLT